MSKAKKDYTKFAKKPEEEKFEEVLTEVEEPEVIPEEQAVETESVEQETEITKQKTGVVANCLILNIRKEPNAKSEVIGELTCLTEVMIDEQGSTDDFYKICTVAGVEGFCMKKYISVARLEEAV